VKIEGKWAKLYAYQVVYKVKIWPECAEILEKYPSWKGLII